MYIGVTISATPFPLQEGSAQEILIAVIEFILSTSEATERITITALLQMVQRAADALVSILVVSEEGNAGTPINTAIHFRVVKDILAVLIYDTRRTLIVLGVDVISVLIGRIAAALFVAVVERIVNRRQRRYSLSISLQDGSSVFIGRLDRLLDLGKRFFIGLRDDQAHGPGRLAAVDAFRLPNIAVAPTGVPS